MPLFAVAIFLSAFLLFQVQPVIARYILPWYGGSPAVWTTCLLFFQIGLLGGYGYAHAIVHFLRKNRKAQVITHLALLALTFILLPITPADSLKPEGSAENPAWGIVALLSLTVGAPYVLLSASGPLLQHWFGEAFPDKSPYRLYAISNLGSMLGLLTYPFVFEPLLAVSRQTVLWSFGFVAYALVAGVCAWTFLGRMEKRKELARDLSKVARPGLSHIALWIILPACGTMLLLSLTNQMCQDIAVVPFLWVLPLSLYLLTFVIAFDAPRHYRRWLWIPCTVGAIGMVVYLMNQQFASGEMHITWQIIIYISAIFFGCLLCHGEVVRLKPDPHYLTGFYLAISIGGALGGLFVSLVAPAAFSGYWELHVSIALLALLISLIVFKDLIRTIPRPAFLSITVVWLGLLGWLTYGLSEHIKGTDDGVIASQRGFYGSLRVYRQNDLTDDEYLSLYHGRISHGRQYTNPIYKTLATTYYSENSGIGSVFTVHKARTSSEPQPMHVGVIGLGVGTIASYGLEGDRFRFYEINPQVEEMAREHFTYLSDCEGEETVVLGDARITLEEEWNKSGSNQFDVLVVDAFSGDSIPIHLLTEESFDLYFRHLKDDGILAVHISNLHLNLSDPVRNLADRAGREAIEIVYNPREAGDDYHSYYSDWILITKDKEFIQAADDLGYTWEWVDEPKPVIWTDDYSNLLQVVEW